MDSAILESANPAAAAERLFAELERPKSDRFSVLLASHPVLAGACYVLAFLAIVLGMAAAEAAMGSNDAVFGQLPSDSIIPLLIGGAIFPRRMIWLPILTYALAFGLALWLTLVWQPDYLMMSDDGARLIVFSFLGNGVAGLVAARFARNLYRRFETAYANERADLALALGATGAYLVTGTVFLALALHLAYPLASVSPGFDLQTGWIYGLMRVMRIALGSGIFLLCFTDLPTLADIRKLALPLTLALGVGVLAHYGIALHPTIDINLVVLAVIIFLPYYRATLFATMSLLGYVLLTGAFAVQTPIVNRNDLTLEVVSLALGVVLFLELAWRHLSHYQASRRRDALVRLERIQAFAGVGYFVAELGSGEVHVDDIGAAILKTPRRLNIGKFLVRLAPADQPTVLEAIQQTGKESAAFTFALSPERAWDDTVDPRFISTFAWYETLWDNRRFAYGAILDITTERRNEESLRKTLAELSRQQTAQVQMFSIISHELRTPASVQSLLIEELDHGASWAEVGPKLKSVNNHLLSVLGDMRQTVQPEQNLPILIERFIPQEKLETVRNTFAIMAAQKSIALDIVTRGQADQPRLGDRRRVLQALSNLVKNSIIHSGARRITLEYEETPLGERIASTWRVVDDGIGISQEVRGTLFQPFTRGASETTARTDGSGLGLFIARTSIELLGGQIECTDAPGGGTVFTIHLPLDVAPENPEPVTVQPPRDYRHSLGGKSLLIAEDHEMIAEILASRLRRIFARVTVVSDGESALEKMIADPHDAVLTDLFMPRMGGDVLTRRLRDAGFAGPIIGMSAAAVGDERALFEASGTTEVLVKPVAVSDMLDTLHRHITRP